ncbi:unnamed protein product [Enterobius vermicularis]|uniref:DB domain-containing protein n=1 Tax=Enterobius vermicularis TaxID=51028 RepID=A0A0N4VLR2_ENTVE|nr:unnamed protein product [Enterobius vermicularis]
MIRQCTCTEFESCKEKVIHATPRCAEKCQHHVVSLGVDFKAVRQCAVEKHAELEATFDCMEKANPDACAHGTPKMIPERYKLGIELALVKEFKKMVDEAKVDTNLLPAIGLARKYSKCVRKCVAKNTEGCFEGRVCSYDLPDDDTLVQQGKQCSIKSGFLTATTIRRLCDCAVDAGLKQLEPTCKLIPPE